MSSFANAIGDALGDNGITIPNNANTLKGGRDYARYLYGCTYVFMKVCIYVCMCMCMYVG